MHQDGVLSHLPGAHLAPLALGGVLASPASGQKSFPGLIAQQTAAEAEQNLNVALLEREAKKEDKRGKAFCGRLVPARVGEGRQACSRVSEGGFSTSMPAP